MSGKSQSMPSWGVRFGGSDILSDCPFNRYEGSGVRLEAAVRSCRPPFPISYSCKQLALGNCFSFSWRISVRQSAIGALLGHSVRGFGIRSEDYDIPNEYSAVGPKNRGVRSEDSAIWSEESVRRCSQPVPTFWLLVSCFFFLRSVAENPIDTFGRYSVLGLRYSVRISRYVRII